MKDNPLENLNLAFDVAEKYLDIPRMLDPEGKQLDLISFKHDNWIASPTERRLLELVETSNEDVKKKNGLHCT